MAKGSMRGKPARGMRRRIVQAVVICLVMALCTLVVSGCRDSDAMKEIIFDQNAPLIDYDNPHKHYINDSTAEQESNEVSSLEVSNEKPESDEVQNLIVYSSQPNSEGFTAKKAAFSATPDFYGIEASETVFFYLSDSVDAYQHAVTPVPEEEPQQTEDEQEPQQNQRDTGAYDQQSTTTGTTVGTSTPNGTTEMSTAPDESGGGVGGRDEVEENNGTDGFTSTEGIGADKNPTMAFNISDRDADIPALDSVAAFGQFAVMVQMVGGSGALAATDAVTLGELQSAGVDVSASVAWEDASGDPAALTNVKAIVDSGAKAILVDDPDAYCRLLSTERFEYLEQNGIQWISLRDMSSSSNIEADVETVGNILQNSAKAAYGSTAASRAADYLNMHDSIISAANGGLARDDVNGARVLQRDGEDGGLSFSSNPAVYVVLVDAWDDGATCSTAGLTFASGAAYANAGFGLSPLSFYMQAGGAINNAAAYSTANDIGQIPVMQFSQTESWGESMWSGTSRGDILYGKPSLLNSGVDLAATTVLGKGLGSDAMPVILVTSGSIKNALIENSSIDGSLYHAYGYVGTETVFGALGISYATQYGNTSLWSCIGSNAASGTVGDPNPIYPSGTIDAASVLVNPSGYFCDWTEGTVESFLEAGWIGAEVSGTYSYSQWQQDVVDFYTWAYGITPDMNRITNR